MEIGAPVHERAGASCLVASVCDIRVQGGPLAPTRCHSRAWPGGRLLRATRDTRHNAALSISGSRIDRRARLHRAVSGSVRGTAIVAGSNRTLETSHDILWSVRTPGVCPTRKVDRDGAPIPATQPGQTLSHYCLVAKIGAGGMGAVWKALDTKHGRHIALKLLPPELTADPERRQRLLREARAAAAVTHPNIAAIHEIDEAEGVTFISMELVDGRTLRSVIGGRPMPIPEVLRIASVPAQSSFIRKTNVGPRAKS